jgi:hypothetical protein
MATTAVTLTASGLVSSKPCRLYTAHIKAGSSAGSVSLRNGTTGSDQVLDEVGDSGGGSWVQYVWHGLMFSKGLYATLTNTAQVTLEIEPLG